MSRLRKRYLSNAESRKLSQFKAGTTRDPSDPAEFARFVGDVNQQFARIAQKLSDIESLDVLATGQEFVTRAEMESLIAQLQVNSDETLTTEGVDVAGTSSTDVTSEGEDDTESLIYSLLNDVADTGVVFGTDDGGGFVSLNTDATMFKWDNTNKRLIVGRTTAYSGAAFSGITSERIVEAVGDGADANHYSTAFAADPQFICQRANGTEAVPTDAQTGDRLGHFRGSGWDTSAGPAFVSGGQLNIIAAENFGGGTNGAAAVVELIAVGSAPPPVEALRIIMGGTELLPSITLEGDLDTGLWHPAADTLALSVGGAEVMRWATAGGGGIVVNEDGDDRDFRIEGDTRPYLFCIDASTDFISIGDSNTPDRLLTISASVAAELLHIYNTSSSDGRAGVLLTADRTSTYSWSFGIDLPGTNLKKFQIRDVTANAIRLGISTGGQVDLLYAGAEGTPTLVLESDVDTGFWHPAADTLALSVGGAEIMRWASGAVTINEDSDDVDFRVESNGAANMLFVEGGTDRVGINQATLAARLHITEDNNSAAIPVVQIDQADVDEPFLKLKGTAAAATLTNSIVAVGDVSTPTVAGYVKVEVEDLGDQIADQDYFMAVYTLA